MGFANRGHNVAHSDEPSLLCHRCGAVLTPGRGDFYVVRIEAFADPTGPIAADEDLAGLDLSAEIDPLVHKAADAVKEWPR